MRAEIITIGDEILIGQIIDSNSAWIAKQVNAIGIAVHQITSISDEALHIQTTLTEAFQRADIILLTGGLGPTNDDITKKTLANYFNSDMRLDEQTLAHVKAYFEQRSKPLIDTNIKQAEVPSKCTVIPNPNGTAPGMWFNVNQKICIAMPGVPFEMMYMMEETIIPLLKTTFPHLATIQHQTILTAGIGESFLAKQLANIETELPTHIKLAYLPKLGQVRLRLSAQGTHTEQLSEEIKIHTDKIKKSIPQYIIACEDLSIEQTIIQLMQKHQISLSLAESCTGGYIAHLITQIPGSSQVFNGSAVVYSNKAKTNLLNVKHSTLSTYGAVSEQTAKEMVTGALEKFHSDYAIAVTGIAGPDGATPDKPIGTMWIAVANHKSTIAQQYQCKQKRLQNIQLASTYALTMLFQLLDLDYPK